VLPTLIALGVLGAAAIYFLSRAIQNRVVADERAASLQLETERLAKQEAAAAAQRAQRAQEFDGRVANVHDAAGAVAVLRDVTAAGGPKPP
jgi:hypothetical protein